MRGTGAQSNGGFVELDSYRKRIATRNIAKALEGIRDQLVAISRRDDTNHIGLGFGQRLGHVQLELLELVNDLTDHADRKEPS